MRLLVAVKEEVATLEEPEKALSVLGKQEMLVVKEPAVVTVATGVTEVTEATEVKEEAVSPWLTR